jgi:hypothetical protein
VAALAAVATADAGTVNKRDLFVGENIEADKLDFGFKLSGLSDTLTGEILLEEVKLFMVETCLLMSPSPPPFLFFLFRLLTGILYYIYII